MLPVPKQKMSFNFVLLIIYTIHEGICLKGLNVCEDWRSKTEYCCAGYEDKYGICTECNIGFTSISGNSCTPCGNNRFGERCLARCNCQSVERCDNVVGCIPNEVSDNTAHSTRATEDIFSEKQTVLKLKLFVYCGGIAGIILLVLGCSACVQFRNRGKKPNMTISNEENRILRGSVKDNQNISTQKKSMHIYHTIDDDILPDRNSDCYAYPVVQNESSDPKRNKK